MEIKLRDYQQKSIDEINAAFEKYNSVLYVLATGGGKCLGKDTPILMYDGTIKLVQDVQVGDQLMGPDSQSRNVISLARGQEEMFRITPVKGDSYTVNQSHILSLRMTGNSNRRMSCANGEIYHQGDVANVSINDYLASNKSFKHCAKGWRAAVEFSEKEYSQYLPPFLLGLWLGDGSSYRSDITTGDKEIERYVKLFCAETDQKYVEIPEKGNCISASMRGYKVGEAYTRNELRRLNLLKNKHIPLEYLTGSREQRFQLMAGLIDSDGYNAGNRGCDVVFKNERLMDDLIYLVRSLGFSAYKSPCQKTCTNTGVTGNYFRTFISGNLEKVPTIVPRNQYTPRKQKKNVLNVGISVESIGVGDYYGFEIDGDHLFMLGDFTVTHNTFTFSYFAREKQLAGESSLIMAHRAELISQASLSLAKIGVQHQIIAPRPLVTKTKQLHYEKIGKSFIDPFSSVSVGSVQTIGRRLESIKRPDWLIPDESQHCAAGTWLEIINHFNTKVFGVTATPTRGDGRGLGCVFQTMVIGKSQKELLRDGDLCKYKVFSTPEDINLDLVKRIKSGESKGDYNTRDLEQQMDKPKIVGRAVEHYEKYAKGKSCLVFAVSVAHAEHIAEEFRANGYNFVAVSAKTDDRIRYQTVDDLRDKKIDGIVNCDLFGEGTDITGVEALIMMRPISETAFGLFSQQVGRALRLSPGKEEAIIIDMTGNFVRHGFPEDKTDWTLEDREKKKRKKDDEEDTEKVKTCPDCFTVHPNKKFCTSCRMDHNPDGCSIEDPNKISLCPSCGYVYPVMVREYEEVEGELVELERQQQQEQARKDYNAQLRAAETPADLLAVDKAMGHKPGAASHKQKAIEEKRAAMANLNKAMRYYKEQIAWGDPDLFNDIMLGAFSLSEKDTRARGFGVKKIEALVEDMRDFAQLRNECIEQPYSGINFRMAIRGRQLGL